MAVTSNFGSKSRPRDKRVLVDQSLSFLLVEKLFLDINKLNIKPDFLV